MEHVQPTWCNHVLYPVSICISWDLGPYIWTPAFRARWFLGLYSSQLIMNLLYSRQARNLVGLLFTQDLWVESVSTSIELRYLVPGFLNSWSVQYSIVSFLVLLLFRSKQITQQYSGYLLERIIYLQMLQPILRTGLSLIFFTDVLCHVSKRLICKCKIPWSPR